MTESRKIAAILASDLVGYSRLAERPSGLGAEVCKPRAALSELAQS